MSNSSTTSSLRKIRPLKSFRNYFEPNRPKKENDNSYWSRAESLSIQIKRNTKGQPRSINVKIHARLMAPKKSRMGQLALSTKD